MFYIDYRTYQLTVNVCLNGFLYLSLFPIPGDIDDCIVTPIVQTQFTPLTEALCDVIMELTTQGQSATIENIRSRLRSRYV